MDNMMMQSGREFEFLMSLRLAEYVSLILGISGGVLGLGLWLVFASLRLGDCTFIFCIYSELWLWFGFIVLGIAFLGILGGLLSKFFPKWGGPIMLVGGLTPVGLWLSLACSETLLAGLAGFEYSAWLAVGTALVFWWTIPILYGGLISTSRTNPTIRRWRREGWLP